MNFLGNQAKMKKAPILEALDSRQQKDSLGFHMPAIKEGRDFGRSLSGFLRDKGAALDLTELPGLDMLGTAKGCIAQSQEYMAQLLGAKKTFYLVNGATGGLEAALLAMTQPERPVLLPAHSHMSLLSGTVLSGCRPLDFALLGRRGLGPASGDGSRSPDPGGSPPSGLAAFDYGKSHISWG